jgi:CelD/BcsL family acetyltransferase involved in cellulose biosynthesis
MMKQISLPDARNLWEDAYDANTIQVPFVSYDWHALWYKTFHKQDQSLILSNGKILAPFMRTGTKVFFSGGEEIADYLDILGPEEEKSKAWPLLVAHLKTLGIKHIHLRNVPTSSATFSFFSHQKNSVVQKEDTTPIIMLPKTWEQYLETLTRKYRHELERKIRKFEREHTDATIAESTNPTRDINIFLTLMAKDPAKQAFLTPEMRAFFVDMAKIFSSQISLLLLSIGDAHAAATLSFKLGRKYFLYNSGFDKTCCQNAGFYLKSQSIKKSIEQGITEYNFLQGSERYKYELGGVDFGVYTIEVVL